MAFTDRQQTWQQWSDMKAVLFLLECTIVGHKREFHFWTAITAVSICSNENKSSKEPFFCGWSRVGSNFFFLVISFPFIMCPRRNESHSEKNIYFLCLFCYFFCPSLSLNNCIVMVVQTPLLALQNVTTYLLGKAIFLSDQTWPEFTVCFFFPWTKIHFEWL